MAKDIRELLVEEDVFDPFADADWDQDEEADEGDALVGAPLEGKDETAEEVPDVRPPRVRIEELLSSMPGHRRMLLRIIDFCREEKSGVEMDERIEELRRYSYSVFSPVIFRELLEKAGAIRYNPSDEEIASEQAPEEVMHERVTDGEAEVELDYLEIDRCEPGTWQATEEGLAIVDEQDDYARVKSLLGKEPQYLDVYRMVIEGCNVEGGRSAKEIDGMVNGLAVVQEPRRYGGYFVGRLEREGAIEWIGGWKTTDVGLSILEELSA